MKRSEIIKRAKFARDNSKAKYKLGNGGMNPAAELPENSSGLCDCTGFSSWCIGERRQTTNKFLKALNGGWIETSAIVKDAMSPDGMFSKADKAVVGDAIVYGDNDLGQGHIGIISEVANGRASKVIHCSSGASKKYGKAIIETNADWFHNHGAIYVRFDNTEEDTHCTGIK